MQSLRLPIFQPLLKGLGHGKGQVVVGLTTCHPGQSRAPAAVLMLRGFGNVDAVMTGAAAGADAGTLMMEGCPEAGDGDLGNSKILSTIERVAPKS